MQIGGSITPYQGQGKDTQQEYFSSSAIPTSSPPTNHLYGSGSIQMPPVAFPPTALSKATPPPLSYSKPDLYTSAAGLSQSSSSQPLSPNSAYANAPPRQPINYPNLVPSSYNASNTNGTDLQRPPLAAQPNSFSRPSYYDQHQQLQSPEQQQQYAVQQPQHRRLSQAQYNPGGLSSLPQWMDGRVGMSGLKNLGNSTLLCWRRVTCAPARY